MLPKTSPSIARVGHLERGDTGTQPEKEVVTMVVKRAATTKKSTAKKAPAKKAATAKKAAAKRKSA